MPVPHGPAELSMTSSQFSDLRRATPAWTDTQRLFVAILERAWIDWCEVVLNGRPDLDQHDEFSEQDATDLRDFVFSDEYGANDPAFLSLRAIAKELRLELSEIREKFRKICPLLEEFPSRLAPKDAPRRQFERHQREQERVRQVAILMETAVVGE